MFWIFALPVAFMGALLWLYRRPLPQLDGRLSLPGLKKPVEVVALWTNPPRPLPSHQL